MKTLTAHTSQETAFVVDDYPYGYTLRCKIRYWMEYRPRYGFRLVSQTTNPKRAGEPWNKPKASTYSPLAVMVQEDNGHIGQRALNLCPSLQKAEEFAVDHGPALEAQDAAGISLLRAIIRMAGRREAKEASRGGKPTPAFRPIPISTTTMRCHHCQYAGDDVQNFGHTATPGERFCPRCGSSQCFVSEVA